MKRSPPLSLDALEFSKTVGAQRSGFDKTKGASPGVPRSSRHKRFVGPALPLRRIARVLIQSLRNSRRQVLENSTDGPTRLRNRQTLFQVKRLCLRSFPERELIAAKLPLPDGNQGSRRLPSEADTLIFPLPSNFILNQHGPSCFLTLPSPRLGPLLPFHLSICPPSAPGGRREFGCNK